MKGREEQSLIFPGVSEKEIERRHRRVKEIMEQEGIAALIVAGSQVNYGSGSHHVRYLTNIGIYFGESYLVFSSKEEPVLFCRSKNQALVNATQVWGVRTQGSGYTKFARDIATYLNELKVQHEKIGVVGIEFMPAYVFLEICQLLPETKFVFVSDVLLNLRMIKTEEELNLVRKAGEIADQAYMAIKETARPGVWEYEVSAAVEKAYLSNGASFPSFLLLASGESTALLDLAGSHRRLREGDTIVEEFSPCYGGYWVQWGRPYVLGKPSRDMEKLFEVALEAYHLTERELRPGKTLGQVRKKIDYFIEERGYTPFITGLQFIGLDMIEQGFLVSGEGRSVKPIAYPIDDKELSPGMVVVIQPNVVTRDLSKGMLLIDTCIITEGAPEILSHSPLKYTSIL